MAAKKPAAPAGSRPVRTKKAPLAGRAKEGADDPKAAIAKELRSLIPRLDAEGLQFLVEQAQVHLYNMQVDELNRTMERSAAAKAGKMKTGSVTRKSRVEEELRIEGSEGGGGFYIVYRGQWVIFSRDEIAQMVRILSAPVTDLERREHLFDWFERERRDLFATIPIADKFDDRLKKIAELLKKNFRLRK